MTTETTRTGSAPSGRLPLYDATAEAASSVVIDRYSTSFGLASRLLAKDAREHIRNVYALVRVADEVVDGPATEAGLDPDLARTVLDELEADTERAIALGFSVNPVVHAFARTARVTGFGAELTKPFFASMRMDLERTEHDDASFDAYVYGSAEVVGLMCLRAFVHRAGRPTFDQAELVAGARALGAAFQKVNFLRDLHADFEVLGRSYFPGSTSARSTRPRRSAWSPTCRPTSTTLPARSGCYRPTPGTPSGSHTPCSRNSTTASRARRRRVW